MVHASRSWLPLAVFYAVSPAAFAQTIRSFHSNCEHVSRVSRDLLAERGVQVRTLVAGEQYSIESVAGALKDGAGKPIRNAGKAIALYTPPFDPKNPFGVWGSFSAFRIRAGRLTFHQVADGCRVTLSHDYQAQFVLWMLFFPADTGPMLTSSNGRLETEYLTEIARRLE